MLVKSTPGGNFLSKSVVTKVVSQLLACVTEFEMKLKIFQISNKNLNYDL